MAEIYKSLNEMSSIRVCIDSYNDGEMQGRIYSTYSEIPKVFTNVVSLLKVLNEMFDSSEYPQASMKQRCFFNKKDTEVRKESQANGTTLLKPVNAIGVKGRQATFKVKVMFRQNASWQGTVTWIEKSKEESFRSALELIMLMDSSFDTASLQKLQDADEDNAASM